MSLGSAEGHGLRGGKDWRSMDVWRALQLQNGLADTLQALFLNNSFWFDSKGEFLDLEELS